MVLTPSARALSLCSRPICGKSRMCPAHGWRVRKTLPESSPSIATQSSSWTNPLLAGKSSAWSRNRRLSESGSITPTKSHCMTGRTLAEMHRRRSRSSRFETRRLVKSRSSSSRSFLIRSSSCACCGRLEIPRIFDGHGHLVGDLLQELDVRGVVGRLLLAREDQHPQAAPRRGQWQGAVAAHAKRLRSFQESRPTCFLGQARNDQGLLGLQDPPRRIVFHGIRRKGRARGGFFGLQDVRADRVARGVVQRPGPDNRIARPDEVGRPGHGTTHANPDGRR